MSEIPVSVPKYWFNDMFRSGSKCLHSALVVIAVVT